MLACDCIDFKFTFYRNVQIYNTCIYDRIIFTLYFFTNSKNYYKFKNAHLVVFYFYPPPPSNMGGHIALLLPVGLSVGRSTSFRLF